ncbi:MFS transporter [Zhihengliuella flava]|uniref:MFS family permease n=1 Tax=Zhihengliuella flava TaxID=1285193 RepID=A0A931D5F1_9MICC|nr:MFS transporter [Zhihengliuella flava]MBG6084040.1 MFS family permease [Zhihengliuella flava]
MSPTPPAPSADERTGLASASTALPVPTVSAEELEPTGQPDYTPPTRHGGNKELLAQGPYRRLLTAWTVSNLGDSALYITAGIWVKVMTGSDALAASVFLVMGIPSLLAPWIGLLADRVPRRALMMANNVATAAVVLCLLAVEPTGQLWIVYVVMALYATCGMVNSSAQAGLLKAIMPHHLLAPANGMFASIDQGLRIVAPLAGAAAFGLWGMPVLVYATATFFLLGALLMLRIDPQPVLRLEEEGSLLRTTFAGFAALRSRPAVGAATAVLALACVGGGMTNSTTFAVIDRGLGLPPEALSIMVAVQGVFSILAGLNAARILNRFGYTASLAAGVAAFGLGYGAQASGVLWLTALGIIPFAFGITVVIVASSTIRQLELPDHLQGRGAAATHMIANGIQALAAGAAAAVLDVIDFRYLVLIGAIFALLGLIPALAGRRAINQVR